MDKSQKKKFIIIGLFLSIFALTCLFSNVFNVWITKFFAHNNIVTQRDNLLVHFIPVGQGDAIAINLPDEKIMLIDTGTQDYSVSYTNYLYEHVLSNSKDKKIDYLVLTHADADHIGGARRLIEQFDVKKIILPIYETTDYMYRNLISFVESKNIETEIVGETSTIQNGYEVKFFYTNKLDTNASSTMIKLSYRNYDFLFTADIDHETEIEFIEKYKEELDCDVLKVAHHGSKMSSSKEFLEVVTPLYSVISCDKNSYGHPTDTVLNNLLNMGSKIYRTDSDGEILFVVDQRIGLKILKDSYQITNLWFNYAIIVLVVETLTIIYVIIIISKILLKRNRDKKLVEKNN